MRGGGQEKTDMIQSGCTFFLIPCILRKRHQAEVWCLFYALGMGENGARLCQNGKNGAKEGFWYAGEGLDCHRK